LNDDITSSRESTAVGNTLYFPIYSPDDLSTPVGYYEDESTLLPAQSDCIFSGAVSFDYNDEQESFESQITVSGSCSASLNSVTGGSGAYACSSGYGYSKEEGVDEGYSGLAFNICQTPCEAYSGKGAEDLDYL